MTIGEKIRILRLRDNMTQAELGSRLSMSRNNISKWETSSSVPSIDIVTELGRIFGIEIKDLVDDSIVLDEGLLDTSKFINPLFSFIVVSIVMMFISLYALFINDNVSEEPFILIVFSIGVIAYMLLRFTQKIIPMKHSYLIVPGFIVGYLLFRQILLVSSGFSGDFFLWQTFVNTLLFGFTVILVIMYKVIDFFANKSFSLRLLHTVKNIVVPIVLLISFFTFLSLDNLYYHEAHNILVSIHENIVFIILFIPSVLAIAVFLYLTRLNWRLRRITIIVSLCLWILLSIVAQNYDLITPFFIFDFQWSSLFLLLFILEYFLITAFKELRVILK